MGLRLPCPIRRRARRPILAPLTFLTLFLMGKKACGPEARALRAKSIGGKRIRLGHPLRLSAVRGGPIGRPAGPPYLGRTLFLRKEGLARPAQDMRVALYIKENELSTGGRTDLPPRSGRPPVDNSTERESRRKYLLWITHV